MDSPRPKDDGRAEAFRRQEAYPCLQEPLHDSHYAAVHYKNLYLTFTGRGQEESSEIKKETGGRGGIILVAGLK